MKRLQDELGLDRRKVTNALNLLQQAGAVASNRKGFCSTGEDEPTVVRRAMEVAKSGERVDRTRVGMMRGYAETQLGEVLTEVVTATGSPCCSSITDIGCYR